jgi:signal transduction histidine kinase
VRKLEVPVNTKEGYVQYGLFSVDSIMIGEVPCLLTTMVDITEQKILEKVMEFHEREVLRFSRSLDAAIRKLNQLSSITRHDINNQLTVILGYLDILESKQHDPTLNVYLQTLATAAQRISTMIRFTKIYESIGTMAPVWQDIRTLVNTSAKEAPLGQVILKNDLPVGAEVIADPLIVKVFYNLMDNAVRHGGKITTIRLSVDGRNGDHVIVCEDDGTGVPAEEREKIFERRYGKNTGLGLFLARDILDITGITIRETGELGKGATF